MTVGEMAYTKVYLKYDDGVSPITVSCTGEGTKVLNISNFNWSKNNSTASGGNVFISFGDDQHHNNISPGIAVYGWRRIS